MMCNRRTVMNPSKLRMSTGGRVRGRGTHRRERRKMEEMTPKRSRGLDAIRSVEIIIRTYFCNLLS